MKAANRTVLNHYKALGIDRTAKRSPGIFSPERATGCATSLSPTTSKADRSRVLRESNWPHDIDYTVKRSSCGGSPLRSRGLVENREESGRRAKCTGGRGRHAGDESQMALQAFGCPPGIEQIQQRRSGDYSPLRGRDRSPMRSSAQVEQVVDPRAEVNRVIGVYSMTPTIDNVPRRCVGQYSPLRQGRRLSPVTPLRDSARSSSPCPSVASATAPKTTSKTSRPLSPANSQRRSPQPSPTPSPLPSPAPGSRRSSSPMLQASRVPAPLTVAGKRSGSDLRGLGSKDEGSSQRQRTPEPAGSSQRQRTLEPAGSSQRQRTPESGRSAGCPTHGASRSKDPARGVVPGLPLETPAAKARGSGISISRASTAESSPDLRTWAAGLERTRSPARTRGLSPCTSLSSGTCPPAIRMSKQGMVSVGRGWR